MIQKYGIMQGVREEIPLRLLRFPGCAYYQILEFPGSNDCSIFSFEKFKNLWRFCAHALAEFFKIPRDIVYVYINICIYMYIL